MGGNTLLRFLGVGNLLDREYRNSPAYQWARELIRNGIEANASCIEIGPEWQSVKATGAYRLQYADDGVGMTREDLRTYMSTLGKGSKAVGGAHDNYALGCRMTLLPWSPSGVIVISVVDGEPNMVKMKFDPASGDGNGEYVLEEVNWIDENGHEGLSTVYPPYYDEELGIDWMEAIPDLVNDAGHGTTFIMLGRNTKDDTLDGDAERQESIRFLTRKYFNTRFWNLPEGVTLRCVEFVNPNERSKWPKSAADRKGYQYRTVKGAQSVVEYLKATGEQTVEDKGTIALRDGTKAHWWLRRETGVDTGGVGSTSGFIAVLYRGELYGHAYANQEDGDTRLGANVYRQFGMASDTVRKRVFIVLEPPEYDESTNAHGVAPSTGRADLYWLGTGLSPRSVKPSDWCEDFAENMPDAIQIALNASYEQSKATDEEREERLKRVMDRLSKRFRAPRARTTDENGDTTTKPTSPGTAPRAPLDTPVPRTLTGRTKKRFVRGRSGKLILGQPGFGTTAAKTTNVTVGYPSYKYVSSADIGEPGMIAAWEPPNKNEPSGCVLIDRGHQVIQGQIDYWQSQYPRAVSKQIEEIVKDSYADVAIAKVSHLHALTGSVISEEQREEMLRNPALTTSLLGLIGEDALISPRLGSLGTKKKKTDEMPANTDDSASQPKDVAKPPAA